MLLKECWHVCLRRQVEKKYEREQSEGVPVVGARPPSVPPRAQSLGCRGVWEELCVPFEVHGKHVATLKSGKRPAAYPSGLAEAVKSAVCLLGNSVRESVYPRLGLTDCKSALGLGQFEFPSGRFCGGEGTDLDPALGSEQVLGWIEDRRTHEGAAGFVGG